MSPQTSLSISSLDPQEKSGYISEVLSYLPRKKALRAYAELFLASMSVRTLYLYSQQELAEFVVNRFRFFEDAIAKQGACRVYTPKDEQVWIADKIVIDCVYPDAGHLVVTLEAIFSELNIRVSRKLHPIMQVLRNAKGDIQDITFPSDEISQDRFSVVYFELEETSDIEIATRLHELIERHMFAVQSVSWDAQAIDQRIFEVKSVVSQQEEWCDLLDWLHDLNFSFFGYGQYLEDGKADTVTFIKESGLGLLSSAYLAQDQSGLEGALTAHVWKLRHAEPFVFDTVTVKSPIQRFENLMRLSLKIARDGQTVNHIFLGILKRSSLFAKNTETPLIHLKIDHVFKERHILKSSYNYNEIIRLCTNIPKFELFRMSEFDLLWMFDQLLSVTDPNDVYCFALYQQALHQLFLVCLVPSHLFVPFNIDRIMAYLEKCIPHLAVEVVEVSGDRSRLHVRFDLAAGTRWECDPHGLEEGIRELIKPWEELVRDCLYREYPGVLGRDLFLRYVEAFPNHYRVRSSAEETAKDIHFLEKMAHEDEIQFNITPFESPDAKLSGHASLVHVYSKTKIDLIAIMPILQNMGFYVVDQLTTHVEIGTHTIGFIQSFRAQDSKRQKIDEHRFNMLLGHLFVAVFNGRTENDVLNALVLTAELSWRQINLLQLYRNFYLQLQSSFSRDKVNATLLAYPAISKTLFQYFESKFSLSSEFGDIEYRQSVLLPQIRQNLMQQLQLVKVISDDMIFRRLLNLMESTLRTNFYIGKKLDSETFISVKIESGKVLQMPAPAPFREIYVYDVGVEGIHLRFGEVARGGLRWSDRRDDFRKEILGLVKTQQTKNVVIVPVGSKGGFVVKKTGLAKDAFFKEGQAQYQKFVSALLDVTDNLDDRGQPKPPADVLCYDAPDPYLVVAADKGTATFSDLANQVSKAYGFWLGDAFASGGSVGYDHKKEGITARGGWECIKLHFGEQGENIQTDSKMVIGVGDMAGDVFGNGMLLSKAIRLVAAFNHIHIFIDPTPDPLKSWTERDRLFKLPGSTWQDYSTQVMSEGGGIFDRQAKEIYLSEPMKRLFNTTQEVMTGEEMVRAILMLKVDLIWFAGIGTYIKASTETHMDVGDQTNDAVRIEAKECQARVIGEGANLAITQRARIELAAAQVRLNTDFIDNSAGVNMSDYEVNIKILLRQLLQDGVIASQEERDQILMNATQEVSDLVLMNNQGQHRLISMDLIRSRRYFRLFRSIIPALVAQGMDPVSERIPNAEVLDEWEAAGIAFPRPLLAVLQAYVKMGVYRELVASPDMDQHYLDRTYTAYFPHSLVTRFGEHIYKHQLKRDIICTQITNKIINQAGLSFFARIRALTERTVVDIAKTYLIFDDGLSGDRYRHEILSTDVVDQEKYLVLLEFEDMLKSLVSSFLQDVHRAPAFGLSKTYHVLFDTLFRLLDAQTDLLDARSSKWELKGFPEPLARRIARYSLLGLISDVVLVFSGSDVNLDLLLAISLRVDVLFKLSWLADRIEAMDLKTSWEFAHRDILLQTLRHRKLNLIRFLMRELKGHDPNLITDSVILEPVQKSHGESLTYYFTMLDQQQAGAPLNLTSVTVSLSKLKFLDSEFPV